MTPSAEEIREIIDAALEQRRRIDESTHVQHHRFLEILMGEYEDKKRLRESVKKQVIGWGVIVVLGGIGSAVYFFVTNAFAKVHG